VAITTPRVNEKHVNPAVSLSEQLSCGQPASSWYNDTNIAAIRKKIVETELVRMSQTPNDLHAISA
jgi:hypothetical protein